MQKQEYHLWFSLVVLFLAGCTSTVESNLGASTDADTGMAESDTGEASDTGSETSQDSELLDSASAVDTNIAQSDTSVDASQPEDTAISVDTSTAMDTAQQPDVPSVPGPPINRFGMGLVGPGNSQQLDHTADLAGPGGYVKLIFPGITPDTQGASQDWIDAVQGAYDRDLIPVIRLAPPWGDRRVRHFSDDGAHTQYTQLANAHKRVVEQLPRREGWPMWLEIHNEPNLCYEWVCDPGSVEGNWISYQQMAREYAFMLRDVADALHAIGDERLKVTLGGLAPGGARRCECGTDGFEAGVTSLDFLREMGTAVPGIWDRLDGFASHSYPAQGEGWGFFVRFEDALTGLHYYKRELEVIGRNLPVLMTETGWNLDHGGRDEVANWTVRAYSDVWLVEPELLAIMPFQLQDGNWDNFAWVDGGGNPYPVFNRVRELRCTMHEGRCP